MSDHIRQIFDILSRATPSAIIDDDCLLIPKSELSVHVSVEQINENEHGCMAVLYFWLTHPSFDEPIYETSAGAGINIDAAIENATMSFYVGIYSAIKDYLIGQSDFLYKTDFFGEQKEWFVVASDLVKMGHSDDNPKYWELIRDELANHIGNKNLYYVKIFTAKHINNEITCECRVNDIASVEIGAKLQECVAAWADNKFHSQKQFFFISQKSPSIPYPHSKVQVEEFTRQAVEAYAKCTDGEKYKALQDELFHITSDQLLSVELIRFLPEMCAEQHVTDCHYSEYITVCRDGKEFDVAKDCFTPYNWIRRRMFEGFATGEFSEKTYKLLVMVSAIYGGYVRAKKNGADMSKAIIKTHIRVPDDYVVR